MNDLSASIREAHVQRQALEYLRLRGIPATRHHAGRVRVGRSVLNLGEPGWPDIVACWRGRFLGVEVKRPGEQPGPEQQRVHAELAAAGAIILIVHSMELALKALRGGAK